MAKAPTFQELNDELEIILEQLQSGEADIDQALKVYERGQEIVRQLQTHLKKAENTIKKLPSNQ